MKKILYLGNKVSLHGNNVTTIESLSENLLKENFEVISYSNKKNQFLRLLDMVFGILYNNNARYILIDTYSTNAFWFAFICSQLARLFQISYLPILHGGNLPNRLKTNPKLSRLLFKNAYKNVAPSLYLKTVFEENGFLNVVHIPNAIKLENYSFKEESNLQPSLLWVRAFANIYNPEMAIYVLHKLKKKYPNSTLTMVGPIKDTSFENVKKLANSLQLSVNFTGKLSKKEWVKLAESHSFFLNTANIDNTPVSVIEAMALGLPIISTNVGGLPFIIENNKNGILVSKNDIESMVYEIEKLLDDPPLYNFLKNNAKKEISQYDWKFVKEKWIKLLN